MGGAINCHSEEGWVRIHRKLGQEQRKSIGLTRIRNPQSENGIFSWTWLLHFAMRIKKEEVHEESNVCSLDWWLASWVAVTYWPHSVRHISCLAFYLGLSFNPSSSHSIIRRLAKGKQLHQFAVWGSIVCWVSCYSCIQWLRGLTWSLLLFRLKPEITDGSQWSLNLKPALSTHVIDQPFRHDSTRFKMLSLIVHIANIIVGILILFNYVFLC